MFFLQEKELEERQRVGSTLESAERVEGKSGGALLAIASNEKGLAKKQIQFGQNYKKWAEEPAILKIVIAQLTKT